MNKFRQFFMLIFLQANCFAADKSLISNEILEKWGYTNLMPSESYDYKHLTELEGEESYRYQFIKSIKHVPQVEDHYYGYTISEECFSNVLKAIKRKISFGVFDDKDYRYGKRIGNCSYIIDTSAKLYTYREQKRIFDLYINQMNKLADARPK